MMEEPEEGMNYVWAAEQLAKFVTATTPVEYEEFYGLAEPYDTIQEQIAVVERILDKMMPNWKSLPKNETDLTDHWGSYNYLAIHRMAAAQALSLAARHEEIKINLGDGAPTISASKLHAWVWSGAKSLWESGHYRSAVEDALKKVNAETQNKVRRRDISETKLFQESFSENAPQLGKPRLRRMTNDGSDTYRSVQRGASALAEGIYAGIRNPFNHEKPIEIDKQLGLEYLAAISVLARWVDEATLEEHP